MSITSVRSRPAFPSLDAFSWPGDFARIADEEWTRQPVDQFGLNYDDVGSLSASSGYLLAVASLFHAIRKVPR